MRKIISSIETLENRYGSLTNLLLQNARRLMKAASLSANQCGLEFKDLIEQEVEATLFNLDDKFKLLITDYSQPCEHCLKYLCICPGIDQEIERNLDEQEKEDG